MVAHTLEYTDSNQDQRGYAVKDSAPRSRGKIDPMARFGQLEPSNLKVGYDKLKELQDADEQVKKIFSLEYADDKEIQVYRKSKLVREIQKDPTDYSLPVKIAVLTVHIRAVAKQLNISKKDLLAKEKLLGLIGRRRKFLKQLRQTDFERFERLLTELGITFTLPPPPQAIRFHTRRYLEKLVVRRKAREQRLKALGEFLTERKNRQMKEIIQLKKELGLDLTEEEVSYIDSEAESG
ncbi:putative 28S ribosomal protein S15, mitochondrial [Apostichopus japonicus]|uniref:Small ribosomal subunit protein uS15m n=1 Tax=Stichopus japonicus TaxID=307972 RepID=A0A2G8KY80_STIJA|nr:putative 28S ribosomal protein S15, mitochondrial [Apostichopus japonicus]